MSDDDLVGVLREIIEAIKYWDHDKCPVCRAYTGVEDHDCPLVRAEKLLSKERP